jgi:hypothetical protein
MRRNLCVLDFDGIVLRGVVAHVDRDGHVAIAIRAESRAARPETALAEVFDGLGAGPATCVVLGADVVAGLVRLPVAANKAAPDRVGQMLRWELEPLFAQQSVAPPLGSILEARGDLERGQVDEIATLQASGRDRARFGALARDLGYVTDAQLQDALAIQERMRDSDGESVCGWSALPDAGAAEGGSAWLAAGMRASRRRWWNEQLARHGRKLLAIYPRLGSAAAALEPGASAALLEVERFAVAYTVVRDGVVASLQVLPLTDAEPAETACRELIESSEFPEARVCGTCAPADWIARLGPRATPFVPDAAIVGAARHAVLGTGPAAAVPAREPRRPLRRRPAAWWALAAALLVGLFAGTEWFNERSLRRASEDLQAVKQPWKSVDREIRALKGRIAQAGTLDGEIELLNRQLAATRLRLARLQSDTLARRRFVPELLDALARAANAEIVIDAVAEQRPGRLRVSGRALSERAVQLFTRAVAASTAPLRLRVADPTIRAERGRHHEFGFQLVPRHPEAP